MCPDLTVFGKKRNIPMTESPERQCLRRAKDGAADSSRPLTLEACLQTVHIQTKETPCGTVWVPAALGGSHGPARVSPVPAGVAVRSSAPWEQREFIYRTERLNHSVLC